VIPATVNAITSILNSCLTVPSIKRFVYTSSSVAVSLPKPNVPCAYDSSSWNEEDVKAAWAPEPWGDSHQWTVYAASKTEAEKALWKFRDEKKPGFSINSVLPATNFGPVITPDTVSSTAKLVVSANLSECCFLLSILSLVCTNVQPFLEHYTPGYTLKKYTDSDFGRQPTICSGNVKALLGVLPRK